MIRPSAPPAPSDIESALLSYSDREETGPASTPPGAPADPTIPLEPTDAVRTTPGAKPIRAYRLREVTSVLALAAGTMLALDSEGLLVWAERLSVGRAQDAWLAVIQPTHQGLSAVGLTRPRQALVKLGTTAARVFGGEEDPILLQGWTPVEHRPEQAPTPVETPLETTQLPPLATTSPQAPVLLLGDSLIAGSLGSALHGALSRRPSLRVVSSFQVATGLTRPEVFDWMKVVSPLLERERPALVICSLGANDASDLREEDRRLAFGEPAWRAVYRARVTTMMRALTRDGARVLWLGLPPMRERWYTRRVETLNRIYREAARSVPRVDYLDLHMLVSGPEGGYVTFLRDGSGRLIRVRLEDGVHYAPAGAAAISRWVVDWTDERLRAQQRQQP